MSAQDATSGNATPIDDAERRKWFATFGCTGGLDEEVNLRMIAGRVLGTATAGDIWRVHTSLRRFNKHNNLMFRRLVSAAAEGYRPVDRDRIFAETQNGSLTDPTTGEFLPGIVEIVLALVDVDTEEMDGRFVDRPLAHKENRAAA